MSLCILDPANGMTRTRSSFLSMSLSAEEIGSCYIIREASGTTIERVPLISCKGP
jgi:hypothetical protein